VLLDRDGVINLDSDDYIKSAEEWQPIPGSLEAIGKLCLNGFKVFVVTNQSGLGRGLFQEADLFKMHKKFIHLLSHHGGHVSDIIYCPHTPDDQCSCRKPGTGMPDTLKERHGLNFNSVPFVGDTLKDLDCAAAINATEVLVLTGKGEKTLNSIKLKQPRRLNSIQVYQNLSEAVETWLSL